MSKTFKDFLSEVSSCDNEDLTSLEGSPKKVDSFSCRYNNFLTLEGGPEYVENEFDCSENQIVTLKGSPKYIGETMHCNDCKNLEDISDLSPNCKKIILCGCNKVKIFTKEITNEDGKLDIYIKSNAKNLRQRIYDWPYYEVVDKNWDESVITVKIKHDNELFMEQL